MPAANHLVSMSSGEEKRGRPGNQSPLARRRALLLKSSSEITGSMYVCRREMHIMSRASARKLSNQHDAHKICGRVNVSENASSWLISPARRVRRHFVALYGGDAAYRIAYINRSGSYARARAGRAGGIIIIMKWKTRACSASATFACIGVRGILKNKAAA